MFVLSLFSIAFDALVVDCRVKPREDGVGVTKELEVVDFVVELNELNVARVDSLVELNAVLVVSPGQRFGMTRRPASHTMSLLLPR